ncbi:MAG: hypothetical protein ABSF64_40300 [Bryobacteraceae bacterium]
MSASNRIQLFRILLGFLLLAALGRDGANGQQNTIQGYNQVLGQWDMSHAALTNPNRQNTGSPNGRDQCNRLGESYFQTDAAAGQNVWYCTSLPSTWTNVAGVPSGASLPATCTVGQLFFDTTAGASFGLNQCAATNSWSALGGGGVSYQGTVTAGAPVVAVSSSKIQSLTASTACTTGFAGFNAAVCATVALTNQSLATSGNLQCGGAICPLGFYRIAMYEWTTSGPSIGSAPQDVGIAWNDTAQAQTYDLSGGAYQTSGTTGVGSYIGAVAYVYSNGTANLTYSVSAAATGAAASIIITVERLL